ncbi:MAG TPA: hypothetical protein VMZ28_21680 [Kofleriaceae bacterium]|nr:hypothetical protein [Kofleriaceae bacterium]
MFLTACGAQEVPPAAPAPAPVTAETPQEEMARLLAEYDAAPESAKAALSARIDRVAGQRYAVWSRLYWHRDLAAAKAEARATGKPILSLRMLGRLDQDLSCANSRFFRVALYANRSVSAYLRAHVVLHWSSERPVPVARIDFGDGRVLERTVAGNSAHYVLDAEGRPVDALPGLYTPGLFLEALAAAEPVAARAGELDDDAQAALVAAFQGDQAAAAAGRFATLGSIQPIDVRGSLANAEMRAVSKAAVEMPVVRSLALGTQLTLEEARESELTGPLWSPIGAVLAERTGGYRLDAASRALFASLRPADWARAGQALPAAGVDSLINAFEAVMTRDAAYNELVLHQQIRARMAAAADGFEGLNQWIYASLFLTPAADPWLGMATPDAFTGLPGDGVVLADR